MLLMYLVAALEFLIHGLQINFSMSNKTNKDRIRQVLRPPISKTQKTMEPALTQPLYRMVYILSTLHEYGPKVTK